MIFTILDLICWVFLCWDIYKHMQRNKLLREQNKLLQQYIDLKERNDLE